MTVTKEDAYQQWKNSFMGYAQIGKILTPDTKPLLGVLTISDAPVEAEPGFKLADVRAKKAKTKARKKDVD